MFFNIQEAKHLLLPNKDGHYKFTAAVAADAADALVTNKNSFRE